ncbi:hypothetical protein LTR10_023953 [Elasticomyces elasticus]|nr:hypothetical protein LTR10_023953 [Elasticomyces elasticus]
MTSTREHVLLFDNGESLAKSKKRRTTDADWIGYKSKLRRLYIDEKKSKKQVVQIMRHEDELNITEKQIKYWFETKWKISKNRPRNSRAMLEPMNTDLVNVHRLPSLLSAPSASGEASRSAFGLMPMVQQDQATDMSGMLLLHPAVELLSTIDTGNPAPGLYSPSVPGTVPGDGFQPGIGAWGDFEFSSTSKKAFHHHLPRTQSSSAMADFGQAMDKPLPNATLRRQCGASASCPKDLASSQPPVIDPETIIHPLQVIRARVSTGFNEVDNSLVLEHSGQFYQELQGALTSDWLRNALDAILLSAYRGAEKKLGSLQGPWHAGIANTPDRDDQLQYMSTDNVNRTFLGKAYSTLKVRPRSVRPDGDIFRAELYRAFGSREKGRRETTEKVIITYYPKSGWCQTGVSDTIDQTFCTGLGTHVAPTIKTFNVVPWDAEIITLVKNDDLSGVRRLFETGKASPTDVTPLGHSLLSVTRHFLKIHTVVQLTSNQYAIYGGASELFHLLLRGGADLQHCDR